VQVLQQAPGQMMQQRRQQGLIGGKRDSVNAFATPR
jgi:hypothetical protein